jgi:hypothetical protein
MGKYSFRCSAILVKKTSTGLLCADFFNLGHWRGLSPMENDLTEFFLSLSNGSTILGTF